VPIFLGMTGEKLTRIALIDSGVNPHHSHVERVEGGTHFFLDQAGALKQDKDFLDRLGHGTALAGIVRAKVPEAELYAVKIFHDRLATHFPVLEAALLWAIDWGIKIINLSLGTNNPDHQEKLEQVVSKAEAAGAIIVASAPPDGAEWFPAVLPGVLGVAGDDRCGWAEYLYMAEDPISFRAHPCPRPLPGPAQSRNFRGHSFASAHLASEIACLAERNPSLTNKEARAYLIDTAAEVGAKHSRT
jgi:subtilisin